MDINKHNYEAFFLDYHEGNLSEDEIRLLKSFLNENPALKDQLDDFERIVLEADGNISFPNKKELKKEYSKPAIAEDQLIAFLEGDLKEDEQDIMKTAIATDETLSRNYHTLRQTISKPDLTVNFPNKRKLKRKQALVFTQTRIVTLAAAAAIILLFAIPAIINFQGPLNTTRESIVISKTYSVAPGFIQPESRPGKLDGRIVAQAKFSQPLRNSVEIARIESLSATSIASQHENDFTSIAYYREIPIYNYYDQSIANNEVGEEKTLAGKMLSGFFNRISSPFKNDNPRDVERSRDFNLWDLAEFGVKSINALGDHEYTLIRQYNEKGNVKGVMILEE
jgi:hypothetical protein